MLKNIILLSAVLASSVVSAQWTPAKSPEKRSKDFTKAQKKEFYHLNIGKIREQLKNAELQGPNAKPVFISVPMLGGKVEQFKVYSFPVVVPELAERYQLGSYAGVSTENPHRIIRFSVAPNDFQSMIYDEYGYQFISPEDKSKELYSVHSKTNKESGKDAFVCSTEHGHSSSDIDRLRQNNSFANVPGDFSRNSDKKYRTLRLVVSTTGEYTQHFGGLAGALAQINATVTRVNGIFEKDFALHLILQDYPSIIYTNGATDPYQDQSGWNSQLQQTLTANVGNANYDIGHLFGKEGNNGNAGCIGCICVDPVNQNSLAKGSGFTTSTNPSGDAFDIDFVAHEIGHQLGANHTFSHSQEFTGNNMEPGSGSTIMGYAGITNANVQMQSDAYFHATSIRQVQANLNIKTCDIETNITNNPPVISPLPDYTIPKGTAFVLTGNATDPEGDAMTYTWEQFNTATSQITSANIGNTTHGASFRSKMPSTDPKRYFPSINSVMNGTLRDVAGWESVSSVARNTTFRFTARDNNSNVAEQQTEFKDQSIKVGDDGPFKITTVYMNSAASSPIEWDVVNTNNAPYNVANVSIDYTTDNGSTWTVLSASTPNDGSENFALPSSLVGQNVKVRVSALNNVFYAVAPIVVTQFGVCDGTAPAGVNVSNVATSSADISWAPNQNSVTFVVRYRVAGTTNWTTTTTTNSSVTLTGLSDNTNYEVQVATDCNGTVGAFSSSVNFTTQQLTYCSAGSTQNPGDEYISNVTLANVNNNSAPSNYTNYSSNQSLQINLQQGQQYTLSVTKNWVSNTPYHGAVSAWIDFNRDGVFEDSERVMSSPVAKPAASPAVVTESFTVPTNAVTNSPLRMRVVNLYAPSTATGQILVNACASFGYGEVEDYTVTITPALSTVELGAKSTVRIYPNPVADVLNVTKVSNKAEYTIVNVAGQVVRKGTISDNKIDVRSLVKGNYILSVKDADVSYSEKFIKK